RVELRGRGDNAWLRDWDGTVASASRARTAGAGALRPPSRRALPRAACQSIEDDMKCRQLTFNVIDCARGVALDPSGKAALEEHLRSCESCAALFGRQRAMSVALRRLADEQRVPPLSPARLNSLVALFDRRRGRSRRATVAVGLSV